jgi:hypothetical protein
VGFWGRGILVERTPVPILPPAAVRTLLNPAHSHAEGEGPVLLPTMITHIFRVCDDSANTLHDKSLALNSCELILVKNVVAF